MKLSSTLLLLLPAFAVASSPFSQVSWGKLPANAQTGAKVPGSNPLNYCGSTQGDILTIETVDLVPNPPEAGKTLVISATGVLHDVVSQGAYVDIVVKYGMITLIKKTFDLCENAGQVDLECPVDQGKLILEKSVDLPAAIPPGLYSVSANVATVDGRQITCLTATVRFSPQMQMVEL